MNKKEKLLDDIMNITKDIICLELPYEWRESYDLKKNVFALNIWLLHILEHFKPYEKSPKEYLKTWLFETILIFKIFLRCPINDNYSSDTKQKLNDILVRLEKFKADCINIGIIKTSIIQKSKMG